MNRTVRNRSFRGIRPAGQIEAPPSPASPTVPPQQPIPQGTIGTPAYSVGGQSSIPPLNTPSYAVAPQPLQPMPFGSAPMATPYTQSQTPVQFGTGGGTTGGTVGSVVPQATSPATTMPPSTVISFGGVTPISPAAPGAAPGAPGTPAPATGRPGLGTAYVVPGVAQPIPGGSLAATAYFVPEMPAALGGAAEDGVPWWLIALFLGGAVGIVYASREPARNNPREYGPKLPRVYLAREYLDRGGYTRLGRYFGIGAPLYRFSGEDVIDRYGRHHEYVDDYVRGATREDAMQKIREKYPNVRFTGRA